ncbi:MAG: MaoC/PaaZ C-terminal domain-containing protein [bacterium]|nr:MaoC/PaaZ C-terminal domain-containing protein [bacterium]
MPEINLDCVGKELQPVNSGWGWKDIALYNIGIGAYDLAHTYENYENGIRVIPTFAVIPPNPCLFGCVEIVGANPMMIVHGEQKIIMRKRPLPFEAQTVTNGKVIELWDKGKGALCRIQTTTKTLEGEPLFDNIFSLFVRGAGGWGGPKGPAPGNEPPARDPDKVIEYQTLPIQHLIYRLTGDINPLHIDPSFAQMAGYQTPILHGLCTFGHVGRAVVEACCGGEDEKLREFEVRFSKEVYPGQKIVTKIWKEGKGKAIITASTDDGRNVITNAAALFDE